MTYLYGRKIELTVSPPRGQTGLDLSQFRIRFSVYQKTIETPNIADIRIYNLSDSTANLLKAKGEFSRVRLSAGYEGAFGLLFDGTIVQTRNGRESPTDTFLDVTAADGDLAYNFAVASGSLAAGASGDDHLRLVMRAMAQYEVTLGYTPPLVSTVSPRGRAVFGMARDQIRDIAQTNGCSWSIQNGQVVLIPYGEALPNTAVVLNSETGMIGLPTQTQLGIIVKTLINPAVKIGGKVQINQKSIQRARIDTSYTGQPQNAFLPRVSDDGFYRVLVCDHFGDTRGQEWYTDAICIALGDPATKGLVGRGVA